MKKLFEILPENLFSILSTYKPSKQKNKFVYADALFVLYKAFKTELQLKREKFAEMLQENLASELLESDFSDELKNDEENNIAGLSKFLVRKLHETGWIEFERGQDFEEYVILDGLNSLPEFWYSSYLSLPASSACAFVENPLLNILFLFPSFFGHSK